MRLVIATPVDITALSSWLRSPSPLMGLGSTAVTSIVDRLLRRGHHVTVVTLDRDVEPGSEVVLESDRLRVRVGPYRPQHRARDGFAVERAAVAAAVRREGSATVHAHWSYEFALGALAADAAALVTFHDWSPRIIRLDPHPYRIVRLGLQAATLLRGRRFTAVSPAVADRMRRYSRRPVSVVPNGIEEDRFRAPQELPDRSGVLLSVASGFSPWKNVGTLLQAFPRIASLAPGATLRLVGRDFEPDGPAQRWADDRGIRTDGMAFVGALPHDAVLDEMRAASVLVHPSLEEACPMVVIEAMAQALPVVGGRSSGGVPWTLDAGRAGVLTDVRSAATLAEDTAGLLNDDLRWPELARRARDRAWDTFRMDAVVDDYEAVYDRMETGSQPP